MNSSQYSGQVIENLLVRELKHRVTGVFDRLLPPNIFLLLRGVNRAIDFDHQTRVSPWSQSASCRAKSTPRHQIFLGLVLTSLSLWEMTHFTTDTTGWDIVRTGITQGLGLGFIFVPLSTVTFSTLAPHYRNEGTALFSLMRNLGSSIGISVVMTYLAQRTQANHAAFADYINPFSPALRPATESGVYNLTSPPGLAALNGEVTRQAATLAYLQDFRLIMFITLAAIPLIVLLRAPAKKRAPAELHVAID